ncbi:MAG: hypothetical protein KBG62_08890, partial [Propionivibrio sp.]|nr:hypothetical protein [Propionivibrio sp.]
AGRQTVRRVPDQQAQNCQTALLRQRGKGGDGTFIFHISNNMETWKIKQDGGSSDAIDRVQVDAVSENHCPQ